MKKTEAIREFLKYTSSPLAQLYTPDMEVQVNVAKDNGERIRSVYQGRVWRGWVDPVTREQWKPFRIPWNAHDKPEYSDSELKFDFAKHVEGIGMTGWDWQNLKSRWFGYDFDSITNHHEGLSDELLAELQIAVEKVKWVTLYRSTSGRGLHLYLFLDEPITTVNHTEHAAVARSLLSLLTIETGFNFKTTVDCVGGVLWCYHRKQEGTNGLTVIKEGTPFPSKYIPSNWREHISVCKRVKKKTHSGDRKIESLSSAIKNFYLDASHLAILQWFNNNKNDIYDWWWDTDYNMLVCHTQDLKKCHEELKLKGIFGTNSSGSSTQNCFCFPIKNGAFIVRRFGTKVAETKTWVTDEHGWTKCYFNAEPSLHEACTLAGALENTKGEYVFNSCPEAAKALSHLELNFTYPDFFTYRRVNIKLKGNKILCMVDCTNNDPNNVDGYLRDKKFWIRVLHHKQKVEEVANQDSLIRHVVSNGSEAGWYINIQGEWVYQNKGNVVSVLVSQMLNYSRQEIEQMIGKSILDPWTLVNEPFEDEYLGERKWNKEAAQLSVLPVQGNIIYWWDLLDHLGSELDEVVQTNNWCIQNDISSGGEYLFAWVASMVQRPKEPLPYLFFFGEQKTGKSTFHEGLALLFKNKNGYARADLALKSQGGFNSEIAHSVLCVVEETNLGKNSTAGDRIKDWVTGKTISINTKMKNVYDIDNTTHWLQCANDAKHCLILRGDTRIIVIEVLQFEKEIPKQMLMGYLEEELPAFLYELINYDLPAPEGRLGLPCLDSTIKQEIIEDNYNELEQFLADKTKICAGHITSFVDFYKAFYAWLSVTFPSKQSVWTSRQVSLRFPKTSTLVKGIYGSDNKICIGNLSLDMASEPYLFRWAVHKNRLKKLLISKTTSIHLPERD